MEPPHISQLRRSTVDSQAGTDTAVNTPTRISPSCSHHDLAGIHEGREGTKATEALEHEVNMKEKTRQQGEEGHNPPIETAVKEKRQMVDLGKGLEEVVIVDWLFHDPEVCLFKYRSEIKFYLSETC